MLKNSGPVSHHVISCESGCASSPLLWRASLPESFDGITSALFDVCVCVWMGERVCGLEMFHNPPSFFPPFFFFFPPLLVAELTPLLLFEVKISVAHGSNGWMSDRSVTGNKCEPSSHWASTQTLGNPRAMLCIANSFVTRAPANAFWGRRGSHGCHWVYPGFSLYKVINSVCFPLPPLLPDRIEGFLFSTTLIRLRAAGTWDIRGKMISWAWRNGSPLGGFDWLPLGEDLLWEVCWYTSPLSTWKDSRCVLQCVCVM